MSDSKYIGGGFWASVDPLVITIYDGNGRAGHKVLGNRIPQALADIRRCYEVYDQWGDGVAAYHEARKHMKRWWV